MAKKFSPPYGDGTSKRNEESCEIQFSPPYGDGTWTRSTRFSYYEFSPPYGDGTYAFQGCLIQTWFSPPYGDGTSETICHVQDHSVFAPLRGWYTKYITEYRKTEELNAWKIFTLLK